MVVSLKMVIVLGTHMSFKTLAISLGVILHCSGVMANTIPKDNPNNRCQSLQYDLSSSEGLLRTYLDSEYDKIPNTKILAAKAYHDLIGEIDNNLPEDIHMYGSLLSEYESNCNQIPQEFYNSKFSMRNFIIEYAEIDKWFNDDHNKDLEYPICKKIFSTIENLSSHNVVLSSYADTGTDKLKLMGNNDISKSQLANSLNRYKKRQIDEMLNHECWRFDTKKFVKLYK